MTMLRMALAGAVMLFAGSALASEHLVGTWTTASSDSRGARAGESGHGLGDGDTLLSGSDEVWTFTVEEMEGNGFHAQWCSPNVCEDAVGVVRGDGESILAADEDGIFIGTLGEGTLELCYLEPGADFRVADCHTLAKE